MDFLLWYWYEGRPSARLKNYARGLYFRLEGMKKRRQIRNELSRLEAPKYEISENIKKLINNAN